MDMNDRLLSVGGQASYAISEIRSMMHGIGKADPMGKEWYVDGNQLASGDGSLNNPFNTLAEAFVISHADIALSAQRHFARRNTIWACADSFEEDLDLLPQKTDVIGVGSFNAQKKCGVTGTHEPTQGAGTRFFNFHFTGEAAAAPIWTLDSTTAGVEFHGCVLDGSCGTVTSGILATAASFLKVIGCEIYGHFATSAISIGAGNMINFHIDGNTIGGNPAYVPVAGILINSAMTAGYGAYIRSNLIRCEGLIIDDESDIVIITGNECFSDVASGTDATLEEYIDGNVALGSNNRISGGTLANAPWPVVDIVAAS